MQSALRDGGSLNSLSHPLRDSSCLLLIQNQGDESEEVLVVLCAGGTGPLPCSLKLSSSPLGNKLQ